MSRTGFLRLLLPMIAGCVPWLPEVADPCADWAEPGLYRVRVEPDDTHDRKPYVFVPASAGPRDLVVMLHGGAQNARESSEATELIALAQQEGFVAVFPNGLGWPVRTWNSEGDGDVDDVAFLDQLVAELSPQVCGDQVLATGFSRGGMMVHTWACEGDRVDAAVPVSGPLTNGGTCTGEPLPIRHYHGTADTVVPHEGAAGVPSVDETMLAWQERNGCTDAAPEAFTIGSQTTCQRWDCQATTELCLIEGWGHLWPGGRNAELVDFDVSVDLWTWFLELPQQ